jgi:pimeloyl-ACP methyl ester carboxylesterase
MKLAKIATLMAAVAMCLVVTPRAMAQCGDGVPGVTCNEYLGVGKKGSHFRISIPTSPAWNGDIVLINHGFELDPLSIAPHNTCRGAGEPCTEDADCSGTICNKVSYLGVDAFFLPKGIAVAASTYSLTGWSVFNSRKDLQDILTYMKKTPAIGAPTRVFVTGFSMGGAVTVDASLRISPKRVHGVMPLCPAAAGGAPTWDAAHDFRLAYDYLCGAVPGAAFFTETDVGDPIGQVAMAGRVDKCFGVLFPSGDPLEAANQAARLAQFRSLIGHTGTDFEVVVIMGFATNGMYDLTQDKGKLSGKRAGWNEGITYTADAGLDAGIERVAAGEGRKKLGKAFFVDYTRGKGAKVEYPIVHLANTNDFLTIPGFQTVLMQATDDGAKARTSAWITGGGHCNFTPEEIEATAEEFIAWVDGGTQPTAADLEATCLALPNGSASTCRFDLGFTAPLLSARAPRRTDWPAAAQ